jgi:hypothetical protein
LIEPLFDNPFTEFLRDDFARDAMTKLIPVAVADVAPEPVKINVVLLRVSLEQWSQIH